MVFFFNDVKEMFRYNKKGVFDMDVVFLENALLGAFFIIFISIRRRMT